MERRKKWFFLSYLTYMDPERRDSLLQAAGDVEELFAVPPEDLPVLNAGLGVHETAQYAAWHDEEKLERCWQEAEDKGIRFLSREDADFPKKLLGVSPMVTGIFVKGSLPDGSRPAAAVIGARRCSVYGKETGYFIGEALGKQGVQIVSGMALGVDGFSMRGGVAAGAPVFAVLGSGADVCYPRENIGLYKDLCDRAGTCGILSERPPGHRANLPLDFPLRNRIISGLSDVLAVVESSLKSGTLITVGYALQQNKEVFAVPGRIGDRLSEGCNKLIRDGAQILLNPEDILQALHVDYRELSERKNRVQLTKKEADVLSLLSRTPEDTDNLLEKTGLPLSDLLEVLVMLEIKGQIRKSTMGGYVRA